MNLNTTEIELAKIIKKKPHWFIRWGITVLFLIAILGLIIWYRRFATFL